MGYEGIGMLLDSDPIFVPSYDETTDYGALESADLILWEWGWVAEAPRALLAVKERLQIPVLAFTTALDRFWRGLEPGVLAQHIQAARQIDFVATLLEDSLPWYRTLCPQAHVFHMPVPVDTHRYRKHGQAPSEKDPTAISLAAPTSFIFSGEISHANRMDFGTFLVYDRLVHSHQVQGTTYLRKEEQIPLIREILQQSNLSMPDCKKMIRLRRAHRRIAHHYLTLWLPHALVQGRWAMTNAYLGIPMVTCDEIETHRRLYPHTVVDWRNLEEAYQLCVRLLEDKEFYLEVRQHALEAIEWYSIANARERLLGALRSRWPQL